MLPSSHDRLVGVGPQRGEAVMGRTDLIKQVIYVIKCAIRAMRNSVQLIQTTVNSIYRIKIAKYSRRRKINMLT